MGAVRLIVILLRVFLLPRAALAAETLALRHQLGVLQRSAKRPRFRQRDRILWVWLSHLWSGGRESLLTVKPETVIRWHRDGFKLYWRWKSRKKPGRPMIDAEIRRLIRQMSRENATWGAPRIHSELQLLGYTVDESTVAKYMIRHRKPPSQTWRTFLENHIEPLSGFGAEPQGPRQRRRSAMRSLAEPVGGVLVHRFLRCVRWAITPCHASCYAGCQ